MMIFPISADPNVGEPNTMSRSSAGGSAILATCFSYHLPKFRGQWPCDLAIVMSRKVSAGFLRCTRWEVERTQQRIPDRLRIGGIATDSGLGLPDEFG